MTELRDGPGSQIPEIILNMTPVKLPWLQSITMYAFTNHGRVLEWDGDNWINTQYTPKELPPKD
jgi:hypothetical protein